MAWFSDEQLKSLQKGFIYVVIIALSNALLQLYGELARERDAHNNTRQIHLQYVEEEMRAWRDLATGYRDTVYLSPTPRQRGKKNSPEWYQVRAIEWKEIALRKHNTKVEEKEYGYYVFSKLR